MTKPSYTPEEVANRWTCHISTVYRMIARKKLKAFKLGKNYRIKAEELLRYEDSVAAVSSS